MTSKMSLLSSLSLTFLLINNVRTADIVRHGLIGYGISMYHPVCAFACRAVASGSALNCTTEESGSAAMPGMMMMGMGASTSAECYATDDSFLQTVAWCISTRCKDSSTSELENYWEVNVVGDQADQPMPKDSYQHTLAAITTPPTDTMVNGNPLNQTSLVSDDDYDMNVNGSAGFERAEDTHERYGLVLILSGFILPVAFSLLRFVPWPTHLSTKFNAYFIYPPLFGSRHSTPTLGIANVPTRGQAFFIAYIVILNVVLSAVGYHAYEMNAWYTSTSAEIAAYITNRVGILSFANLPLLILYAGRNNILLWVTNWSHGTFLLLHKWIACICTLQAVVHSLIYLQQYVASGTHSTESKMPYWIWGATATVGMSILLPTSALPLRRKMYELFLAWHIVISVFVVVGCYLHIIDRFNYKWGYENWIYAAMAVWGFDRLMRVVRLARNGVRTAIITPIDNEYVRVDIEGVSGNGHAYLYFPTLTWRVWENHPFSVASSIIHPNHTAIRATEAALISDIENNKIPRTSISKESQSTDTSSQTSLRKAPTKVGLTFLLRVQGGLTSKLSSMKSLKVLVESPYGIHEDLSSHSLLIGIAGGVGITAVTPFLRSHPGRTKLFWGSRSSGLIDEMQETLAGIDKEVFVGRRLDCYDVLERELAHGDENAVVVVSGPAGMADDVRNAVCRLGREKRKVSVRLVQEAFSW